MMQLRWLVTNYQQPKLQYRQQYNSTVYAGMPTEEQKMKTAVMVWSDWMDVPSVDAESLGDRP